MTRPLLLAALLALPAPLFAQVETAEAAVDAFHAALGAGDRDGALAALAEDVIIFESGGAELSRQEYASHHLGGDIEFVRAVKSEVEDRSSGEAGDVAWVLTRSNSRGTFHDREVDSRGTETMLLRRTGDAWRIVHIHWSSRNARR